MSDQTLYLVQTSFSQTNYILNQLEQIYNAQDHVVLMGDAVLFVQDNRILNKKNLYVLENDAEILVEPLPNNIKMISYDQFAALILDFKRCVSLK